MSSGKMAEYGPEKAFDGNGETRWATDAGTKSAWLEVDLGKPAAIGRCVIEQAYPELHRVRTFAVEYWQDGKWRTCYRGENLGRHAGDRVPGGDRPTGAPERHRSHRRADHLGSSSYIPPRNSSPRLGAIRTPEGIPEPYPGGVSPSFVF